MRLALTPRGEQRPAPSVKESLQSSPRSPVSSWVNRLRVEIAWAVVGITFAALAFTAGYWSGTRQEQERLTEQACDTKVGQYLWPSECR